MVSIPYFYRGRLSRSLCTYNSQKLLQSSNCRKLQTIAELENHIEAEIEDIREQRLRVSEVFFAQYGHDEASLKDLALICFIKDVDFEERRPQASLDDLYAALETEARAEAASNRRPLAKTGQLVQAILQRVELLLQAVLRIRIRIRVYMFKGLPDPDPLNQRHGSGSPSGSFYHQAKIVLKKTLIPIVL
jgi:hypothetical protein